MDALIIAAGYGSRLQDISESKPLTPIAGVALIELGVRQAKAAGAQRVVVTTGHEGARVEAFLAGLAERAEIPIHAERIADWSKPNGHSVMAGAAQIDGNYLLMMCDHIFEASILQSLAGQDAPDRGVTLAIDRRLNNELVDPDDATWVETGADGLIRTIGKTIPSFDAVDCGAFLATPELAGAIAAAIAEGQDGSLSEGMQRLADVGRAATMNIGDAWWLDVDEPHYHAIAEAEAPTRLAEVYALIG
jgi:choline kinase